MSAFTENFLRDGAPRGWLSRMVGGGDKAGDAPKFWLGAFGKHPGWDDHLDDIGLETETLALAKQILYVEGIGGRLNAGVWDALPDDRRLAGFHHLFLWVREGGVLAGRLWSSRDRKGRDRYPMVICAEIEGLPLEWTLDHVLPRLEIIEAACRETQSADDVRGFVEGERQALAQEAAAAMGQEPPAFDWPPEWSDAGEPELRVLYRLRSQLTDHAPGSNGKGDPREIRLSVNAEAPPAETLRHWARTLDALLDPAAPALFLLPLEGDWLDIVVGEPVSESFFALRAAPGALPPADRVPYTLDPVWSAQAGAFLARLRMGTSVKVNPSKEFWRLPAA